jgi:hypothetical protein
VVVGKGVSVCRKEINEKGVRWMWKETGIKWLLSRKRKTERDPVWGLEMKKTKKCEVCRRSVGSIH